MLINYAFFVIFSITAPLLTSGDEILGCGGFIKSHIPIEYSRVEVGLYTRQGSKKDVTDCAPNNGYYFLPVDDHGEYILRVSAPAGWKFEPSEVAVNVDGQNDPCSLGKDVNFVFVGFAVTGKVVSAGSDEGPEGVTVALHAKGAIEPLIKVKTNQGGTFSFPRVAPGQYELLASRQGWKMSKEKASLSVTADNYKIDGTLTVGGYPVSGKVTSDKEPIGGVSFVLHGESSMKTKPPGCLESPTGLCRVESGPNGEFSFPVLQPGAYRLVPHYAASKEGIAFDVRPKELKFTVKHDSLTLTPEFQVKGFTVTGKVKFAKKGAGVPDAKIYLNGQQRALAGQDGNFRLENMQAGNYRLSAVADKLEFPVINVRISPSSPILPDLLPSAFAVCGIVHQQEAHLPLGVASGPRTVQAVSLPDKVRVLNTQTEADSGIYCIMLSPGEYIMSVLVTDNEVKKGLKFSPSTRTVNVVDKSISVIDFSPLRATLSGRIKCIGKCADTITLILVSFDDEIPPAKQTINEATTYTFKDVLPGQYDLHIKSEQGSLCWRDSVQKVTVSTATTTVPEFIQTGYTMVVKSSHDTAVDYFNLDNVKIASLQMHRGSNEFCVPGPGPYMIVPVSCHEFPAPWFSWELATGPVVLEAIKHKFGGVIYSSEQQDDVIVNVAREDGTKVALGPLKGTRGQNGFEYRFEVLAKPREELKIEPSADKLIFAPASKVVSTGEDCLADAVVFRGEKGFFVEGSVNPPLEGVEVKVSQGGEQIAVMITDKLGQYKIGPLPTPSPGNEYEIVAEREGYQMSKIKNGVFEARKLAEVVVTVTDSSDGSPLAGVLLSLSGGDYRKNSQAGADGVLTFYSLWPGEYFLRPKLKEYKFEPQSKIINVAEGATVQVKVSGKRVAFSCFGAVTSLSKEAEPGVILEAIGIGDSCKNQQEEAISEVSGQFRIRGLLPKCEYSLRLKQGVEANQHISRISPSSLKVRVEQSDVSDVRIIAWRPPPNCDVAVHVVNCPTGVNLRVRLYRESEPDGHIFEKKLEPSTVPQHYFILPVLPNDGKAYFVQLDPIGNQQKRVESLTSHFSANSSFRYVRLELGAPLIGPSRGDSRDEEKSTKGSIIFFTLAAVLAMAYFNQDHVLPVFAQIGGFVRQVIASAPTGAPSANPAPIPLDDDLMVEPVSKKKAKLRKA
ncbi:BOS complex subunit NOMO3 [Neocloeon triangulifer]|uniref:BOS complex subunit NOMO3 n=1 Tax=Neocloeon triangulifer TaxID=2078957 RepID=UPI00286FA325|nr:BOS complex subunit NOMO3 [Neocloeon triangulifer]